MWINVLLLCILYAHVTGTHGIDIWENNSNCSFHKGSNCPGKFNVTTNCSVACDGVLEDYETDEMRCYNSCKCIFHEEMCLEGDIRVSESNQEAMNYMYKNKTSQQVARGLSNIARYFWPIDPVTKLYYVPYVNTINHDLTLNALNAAIADFNAKTRIRLIPRTTERNYINIIYDTGCYSYIGMIGGAQNLSLGNNCHFKEVILHEIMHALGFHHEQSRPDRNNYVTVIYNNIIQGFESNFQIAVNIDSRGSPYDYYSLMHYGRNFFSVNRATLDTLETINSSFQNVIGRAANFSVQDLYQLNLAYNDPTETTTSVTTTTAITGNNTASATVAASIALLLHSGLVIVYCSSM